MSKAMQYIMAMIFTLSMLLVDTFVGGWWWSTLLISVLLTIIGTSTVEALVRYVEEQYRWNNNGLRGKVLPEAVVAYRNMPFIKGNFVIGKASDMEDWDIVVPKIPKRLKKLSKGGYRRYLL